MLTLRVSLKFHLNQSFLAKGTNKTSLRTFCRIKIYHETELTVMDAWIIFLNDLTSKMSLLGVKMKGKIHEKPILGKPRMLKISLGAKPCKTM